MTSIPAKGLNRDITEFLRFKRALGHVYEHGERTLRNFERFAVKQARKRASNRFTLKPTLAAWLARINENHTPTSLASELGTVRQYCLYRRRHDPESFVPDCSWAPHTRSTFKPYVLSRAEVTKVLKAARRYRGHQMGPTSLYTLFLILYCTGLRPGEAARLITADINLSTRILFIRESKGRSRLVPFGADLALKIDTYLAERERIVQSTRSKSEALFLRLDGTAFYPSLVGVALQEMLRAEELIDASGSTRVRPYDFRHTFAVHRLTEWYRKGIDIHARLPWLSAYMGHLKVLGTEVYLHATPELLRLASRRFERRVGMDHR